MQTKQGAQAYELELQNESQNASSTSAPCSAVREVTIEGFAPEWLETYAVVNNKPSEVVSKESILRVHLIPFFEKRQLSTITARDVESYKAKKVKEGLSASTINNHLAVLRKMLKTAEEWELLDRVPPVRRLKAMMPKFDWLRPDESARFLAAVERQYPQWKALFYTALHTGMRRGELFALEWSDVDLVARTVTVRRSVYRGKIVSPKNGKERTIPLSRTLAGVLTAHQLVTKLKGDLVFCGPSGDLSIHQDHVDRPLKGALKLAGLRNIRFHDIRHSFASQLVSAGRSLKEIQELLGHQSITVTMRYAHLSPDRMRDAVSVFDEPPSKATGT